MKLSLLLTTFVVSIPALMAQESCYRSTRHLLRDMLEEKNNGDNGKVYTLCSNTIFKIGSLVGFWFTFWWHQHPLLLAGKNNIIKCGDDGRRENNCIFESAGAFTMMGAVANYPQLGIEDNDISGTKVQGLTFRGKTRPPFGLLGALAELSHSVVFFQAPGNVVLEDCVFMDLESRHFLRHYFVNDFLDGNIVPGQSSDVTFESCYFKNIVLERVMMNTASQINTIRGSIIEDLKTGEGWSAVELYRSSTLDPTVPASFTLESSCVEGYEGSYAFGFIYHINGTADEEVTFTAADNYASNLVLDDQVPGCAEGLMVSSGLPNYTCVDIFEAGSCQATSSRVAPCFYGWFTPLFCPQ